MRIWLLTLLISGIASAETPKAFRLSLASEPSSLSTLEQKSSSGAFLIDQIDAPLLRWSQGHLVAGLATCKDLQPNNLECEISNTSRWSNGEPILARQVQKTFLAFLDPRKPGIRADLLLGIRGAAEVLNQHASAQNFGFKIDPKRPRTFILQLIQPREEFKLNLTNPLLSPQWDPLDRHPEPLGLVTSGPFHILEWKTGSRIVLTPNPFYHFKTKERPPNLELRVITEDAVALALYQSGELDFLRHLPTVYIPLFQNKSEFHKVPQFRFDFFAFGPALDAIPELREALSGSLNYSELQKMFWAEPRPGCPGIPKELYAPEVCAIENETHANQILAKLEKEKLPKLQLVYSKAGGADHDRTAQWLQDQWRQKLGLDLSLQQLENKTFLQTIAVSTPPLFRRGLSPDRPTCLAVLENFSKDGGENSFHIPEPELEKIVAQMKTNLTKSQRQQKCHQAMSLLIDHHHIIPTGPLYFSVLVKDQWQGWELNNLNQLNLAELRFKSESGPATH